MKRQKRVSRTAGDWKKIVEGWSNGDESQKSYCERLNIGFSSFTQWRGQLKKKSRRPRQDAFMQIGPVEVPVSTAAAVMKWANGVTIELTRMPDPEWLKRVVGS